MSEKIIYSTENSQYLAEKVAKETGYKLANIDYSEFADGEGRILFQDPTLSKNKDCIVIGSAENHKYFANLIDLTCALRQQFGAKSVEMVVPYLAYSTMEKRSKVAGEVARGLFRTQDLFNSGAEEINFIDLHSKSLINLGGRNVIGNHIYTESLVVDIINEIKEKIGDIVLVSPDAGRGSWVKSLAEQTNLPCEVLVKIREKTEKDQVKVSRNANQNLNGKNVIIFDDMIRTGGTAMKAADMIKESGANSVQMIATHGILPKDTEEKLSNSSIDKFYLTDTHSRTQKLQNPKLFVVKSVAGLVAENI